MKITDPEIQILDTYIQAALLDDKVENLAGEVRGMRLGDPDSVRRGSGLYFGKYACPGPGIR